jgi:hypothetical protein
MLFPAATMLPFGTEGQRVDRASHDGDDAAPLPDLALPMGVVSDSKDSAAREQADCSHQGDVGPVVNLALG